MIFTMRKEACIRMNSLKLQKLKVDDSYPVYDMLQRIGPNENEFKNTANGLTFDEFKIWLMEQDAWSRGECLPEGYVPQTIFWLYDGDTPVGIGKIRHQLNERSRAIGGNIGYAIDPKQRGNGYATILLSRLVEQAEKMGIEEKLLSVEKYNPASKRVIEKCDGRLIKENNERWFFSFD